MTSFSTAAAAALLVITSAGAATAQTGFYVTGAVGFAKPRDAGLKNGREGTTALLNRGSSLNEIENGNVWILGVGYRFTPMFRADLTYGSRTGLDLKDGEGTPTQTAGRNDVNARIRSRAAFLTGYVDGGSLLPAEWSRFNPYVGFGVGRAVNRISNVSVRNEAAGFVPPVDTTTSTPSGRSSGFAWQLAAGVGIAVTSSLTVDLGYRYVDLGSLKVDQGRYNYSKFVPSVDTNPLKGDLRTHEFAVGLRYSF